MKHRTVSVCVFTLLSAGAARAQEPEPAAKLDDIVVTATGSETAAFETSLPVNRLDSEELKRAMNPSVATMFEAEPGLDVVTTGAGSVHPMIRGLHGERILVLVDGIRLSEQRPGGNHAFSLDPAQIESVEVVRGPASVLYGSDAVGGVINFLTRGADELVADEARISGEADMGYESATHGWWQTGHFRFGQGRWNGYVGGTHRDSDNVETADGELKNSFYDGFTLWGGGNYTADLWTARADYSFMEADIGIPGDAAFAEDYFDDERHHRLHLGFEHHDMPGHFSAFKLDFGFQRHERNRYRRKVAALPPPVVGDLEVGIQLDINTYTLKPQVILEPADDHRVTAGLDFFFEDATSGRTIGDTASPWVHPVYNNVPVIPDATRVGAGVFVQDEIALAPRWNVTPGLRADWIRSETDGHPGHNQATEDSNANTAVSGNLGVLYKLRDDVNLYANVGRAFRAPTLLELYFDGPHDVTSDIGDPDLEPETSWNLDAGVKVRTERLSAMAGLFYNRINDYIVKEQQPNGDYQYKNYAQVSLYGGETGLDYEFVDGLSAFASVSYVRGENEDTGDDLPSIPPLKFHYGVRADHDGEEGRHYWGEVALTTAAGQHHPGPNERETAGYTRLDLSAGINVSEHWSVTAAVENVTDQRYENHVSSAWQAFGVSDQPGRNAKIMLSTRF